MRERPILFSSPMVRAILDGSKTQTRRAVKGFALELLAPDGFTPEYVAIPENGNSPYGYAGDRLLVKETFFAWGRWETRFSAKKGRDEWHFIDMTLECGKQYRYVVNMIGENAPRGRGGVTPQWWKRPAIFMPRAASRINLDNDDVRVERLQDISEEDAVAEGVETIQYTGENAGPNRYSINMGDCWLNSPTAAGAYRMLWESINGPGSWDANPWVWVVKFRRLP